MAVVLTDNLTIVLVASTSCSLGFSFAASAVNLALTFTTTSTTLVVFVFIMAWESVRFDLKVWRIVLVKDVIVLVILMVIFSFRSVIKYIWVIVINLS